MCARLLACPLCSQPGFLTLDALRTGLVSVATRPLACPVCNEVLLGIDKLTIHLFGHTVAQGNAVVGGGNESAKIIEVTTNGNGGVQAIVRNAQPIPIQSWNVLSTGQTLETTNNRHLEETPREPTSTSGIYIPIDEIETFRNLTAIKDDVGNVIPVSANQSTNVDINTPSQVIFLQNLPTQSKIFSGNLINQTNKSCSKETVETNAATLINGIIDKTGKESYTQTSWSSGANCESSPSSDHPPPQTDRLADLVKNAEITGSPSSSVHESYEYSNAEVLGDPRSKPLLKSSRILSTSERPERCDVCGFHFPDKSILVLHKQLVHATKTNNSNAPDNASKNYPCHLCTKFFKMRGSLMVHMRVAHPGFNCTTIAKEPAPTNEQSNDPSTETETTSSSDPQTGFNCPTCGKSFKKEQHVIQHLKIHEGKQWECDVCSKMFTTKYFLKKHKRLHSGEMPYKCTVCDKTFTFQQSYHKHRLYHKDDKPHACATCGRSFKELSTLHNHERIHTGEKPFACETCGKCFRQRVSYLVHRRIHTGVMPYKCTTCGKNFRYKVSQRTHKCQQQSCGTDINQSKNFVDEILETNKTKEIGDSSSQDEESMESSSMNEENQYIFILNDDGQHVLKRKLDVDNTSGQALNKSIGKNKEELHEKNSFIQSAWNQETTNQMEYKINSAKTNKIGSNMINDRNLWSSTSKDDSNISSDNISKQCNSTDISDECSTKSPWTQALTDKLIEKSICKDNINNTSDFFDMVMSPTESEIPSPSAEMKHLTLSSPVNNQESSCNFTDNFSVINSQANSIAVQCDNVEDNFNQNDDNLSSFQTINEESLKELLNSITDN